MNWTIPMDNAEFLRNMVGVLVALTGVLSLIWQTKLTRQKVKIEAQNLEIEKVRADMHTKQSEDNQQEWLLTAILVMAERMEGITNALIARTEATDKERAEWHKTIEAGNAHNSKIAESLVNMSTGLALASGQLQEQQGLSRELAAAFTAGIADVHSAVDETAAAAQSKIDANTTALEAVRAELEAVKLAVNDHTVRDQITHIEQMVQALQTPADTEEAGDKAAIATLPTPPAEPDIVPPIVLPDAG